MSGWDTSQVTNMVEMFFLASSLMELDISSWDTSQVVNTSDMFNEATTDHPTNQKIVRVE